MISEITTDMNGRRVEIPKFENHNRINGILRIDNITQQHPDSMELQGQREKARGSFYLRSIAWIIKTRFPACMGLSLYADFTLADMYDLVNPHF